MPKRLVTLRTVLDDFEDENLDELYLDPDNIFEIPEDPDPEEE